MPPDLTRRGALAAVLVAVGAGSTGAAQDQFAELEVQSGGRLGVAALDTRNGARLAHRAGERFAMCSTFKLLAVSAALAEIDRGAEHLDRFIPYGEADLLSYAPVTRAHVAEGGLPLATLCRCPFS